MNDSLSARTIALLGALLALIFVFLVVETFAFSALFGNFTPAALTIPLALAISLTGEKWRMFVGGTLLGLASFILAVMIANPVFLNPLVSILPRTVIGVVAYLVFALFKKIFANAKSDFLSEVLPCSLGGIFGVLTNTVLVITMMWVFDSAAISAVFTTILSINFVAEVVSAAVLVPVFAMVINRVEGSGRL